MTPSPPSNFSRRLTLLSRKYIETLQWNNVNDYTSNESMDLVGGKYQAFRELIKGYFGGTKDYMHISQLSDDGIDFLMGLALNENDEIFITETIDQLPMK